jgi:ubiquitin carboxyl-terminal hydrolase 7
MIEFNGKINDRHEFPLDLDLGDYLDDDAERQGNIYSLHGYVIIPHVYRL